MIGLVALVFAGCHNNPMLEAISLTPSKTTYTVGESVAPSDIVVMATYSDGSTKTVSDFSVTPATFSEAGTITVTVSYSENGVTKTASYEVSVSASIVLVGIAVNQIYTGNYFVGDTLTEDDITVTAAYSNGSNKTVSGWTTDENFSAAATDKPITISYSEEGIRQTATITINIINSYTFSTEVKTLTGYNGTAGDSVSYVEFGDWPQTIKKATVLIDEVNTRKKDMGMFTYYLGSDGNWYCKAFEDAHDTGSQYTYSNGEQVKQNSYQWFKVEPIKWRVLTDDYSGKKLLFAESGLIANVPYYDYDDSVYTETRTIDEKTIYSNNYKHSKIRAWLNGLSYNKSGSENSDSLNKGFLQTAFKATALEKIVAVDVDNSEESTNPNSDPKIANNGANTYACEPTQDKIFLLSVKEASNSDYGFAEWDEFGVGNARIRKPTDFALANCAYLSSTAKEGGQYFLRSPYYYDSNRASCVNKDGDLHNNFNYVLHEFPMVVPALCID